MTESAQARKQLILVLGMARSGTSAITRGLQALGVDLGAKMMEANDIWNPKGFFEDKEIVEKINRSVLNALNDACMTTRLVSFPKNNRLVAGLRRYAAKLVKERLEKTDCWAFKDPRTSRLLPFWQDVLADLQVDDYYLIALRNPLASAYSYQRVTGCDLEEGLMLWVLHMVPAIQETHHKKRLLVSYEAMMQHPREQLSRIQQAFGLAALSKPAEMDAYANQFLDKKLRHFDHDLSDLSAHDAVKVVPLCAKLYALLSAVAADEIQFTSTTFVQAWQALMQEFEQAYPLYHYCARLLERNIAQQKELALVHRSWGFRLSYPLRQIKQFFRKQRKQKRYLRLLQEIYQ